MVHLYVNYGIVLGFVVFSFEGICTSWRKNVQKNLPTWQNYEDMEVNWDGSVIISMKHILQYLKLKRYIIITPITTWQG